MRATAVLLLLAAVRPTPGAAQIDYRNLDDHRPVVAQDAYVVERYAAELELPYGVERVGGGTLHLVTPELTYGVARDLQVGLAVPVGAMRAEGDTDWGLAGLRLGALRTLNTESAGLPGLGLGAEAALPVGALAGDALRVRADAIATRSWGLTRLHVNIAATLGGDDGAGLSASPDWMIAAAVDRTLLRRSALLVGEISVQREPGTTETAVSGALGGRLQLTPTMVVDAGVARRLTDAGPDLALTFGLSHSFGVAWLLPSRAR